MQATPVRAPRLLRHHVVHAPQDRPIPPDGLGHPQSESVESHGVRWRRGIEVMHDPWDQRRKRGVTYPARADGDPTITKPLKPFQPSLQSRQGVRLRTNVPHLF